MRIKKTNILYALVCCAVFGFVILLLGKNRLPVEEQVHKINNACDLVTLILNIYCVICVNHRMKQNFLKEK